ncbi:hypothetical protein JAAARDRAFT_665145 [Jaapia argillacea MUCL 33604]|uniref:Uncharacterized protein n=1 Tax=Jaapia argillacea MUCL 33604 TaxID=933084 RepID=A0A067Q4C1_9AGAM|nr:hypothetical protein JAAARDRAFT_665145 [Jaapia argillacea MUCL 33604]
MFEVHEDQRRLTFIRGCVFIACPMRRPWIYCIRLHNFWATLRLFVRLLRVGAQEDWLETVHVRIRLTAQRCSREDINTIYLPSLWLTDPENPFPGQRYRTRRVRTFLAEWTRWYLDMQFLSRARVNCHIHLSPTSLLNLFLLAVPLGLASGIPRLLQPLMSLLVIVSPRIKLLRKPTISNSSLCAARLSFYHRSAVDHHRVTRAVQDGPPSTFASILLASWSVLPSTLAPMPEDLDARAA